MSGSTAKNSAAGGCTALQTTLIVGLAVVATSVGAVASLPGPGAGQDAPYVVIYPPWTSEQTALMRSTAAGLRVLRPGIWPFVVIVAAGDRPATAAMSSALTLKLDGLAGCLDTRVGAGADR